jgi:hypothetical protein
MNGRPKMPVPSGELSPRELCRRIADWAASQGYSYEEVPHGSEYAKVFVRDPAGGETFTTVPNAHHGRKLRRDQVRYTVQAVNNNWSD